MDIPRYLLVIVLTFKPLLCQDLPSGSGSGSGEENLNLLDTPVCGAEVDVVFLVQGSISMGDGDKEYLRNALEQVMSYFAFQSSAGFCMSLVVYGEDSETAIQTCSRDTAMSQSKLLTFTQEPGASVGKACGAMNAIFQSSVRPSAAKLGVIIASTPPSDLQDFQEEVTLLKNADVRLVCIGVGGLSVNFFPNIDADTFVQIESYQQFEASPTEVQDAICDTFDICKPSTFVLNPRSCTSFLWCTGFSPPLAKTFEITCPVGLFYNPANNVCDYPENTRCLIDPCQGNRFGQTGSDSACFMSWTCRDGRSFSWQCCPADYRFDEEQGCVFDSTCVIESPCTAGTEPLRIEDKPKVSVCDKSSLGPFSDWYTENGEIFSCDYNEVFDESICECTPGRTRSNIRGSRSWR